MEEYSESTYGDRIAEVYDQWYSDIDLSMIETLAELANGGCALELGIGTGRIALPMHQAGIEMHGIDASKAMLGKLKSKPGGDKIQFAVGDFAAVDIEGQFDLIFVVFNTFFALMSQELQVRCFKNVAKKLTPAGVFVIEAFIPDMKRFDNHQTVRVTASEDNTVRLEASQVDMIAQKTNSKHISISEEGIRIFPVKLRYAWPAELDLMAQLAGLSLKHRWSSWRRDELSSTSLKHISVYG